ncbi:MAG TPA: hypothetical protein VLA14_01360 [Polyangia bacterium]|jgi:hypothetical protein|nr:hypothetical protein [Polyangia bacterium]
MRFALVVFQRAVVVANDADEGVDRRADPDDVPEDLEPRGRVETVVEPRSSHEPDADVSGDLEPEGASRERGLLELFLFTINGVRSLTRQAAFIKRRA